jgi:flagellar biosynthesis/type III secretory pathway protein FliH
MTFSSDEVKPFSFNHLEKKEIPEEQRVISIWRKIRSDADAAAAENAEPAEEKQPESPAHKTTGAKAQGAKAKTADPKAAKVPASRGHAPEEEAPASVEELPPIPKLILRPRKPDRTGFKRMASVEERPKGSFTGFTTSPQSGPDGLRTIVLDAEREAEEEAEKTAAERRAELMAQAQAEAAALKQRAQAEGQKQGYAQGLAKAREEVRAELMPVLQKFAAETQGLLNHRAEILQTAEKEILELVLLIGKKVLHAELQLHPEAVAHVVRHALGRAIGWGHVTVRLNPEDCVLLEEVKGSLSAGIEGVAIAELAPTPSIARGGCILESNLGEVDVRLELQLGEVEQALRQALGESLEAAGQAPVPSLKPAQPPATEPAPAAPPQAPEAQPEVQAEPYRLRELGGQPPEKGEGGE